MDAQERDRRVAEANQKHAKSDRRVDVISILLYGAALGGMYLLDWNFWLSLLIGAVVAMLSYFILGMIIDGRRKRRIIEIEAEFKWTRKNHGI